MAKPISRLKKTIIVASAIVLTLGGAGVALAYWTSTGTGVGEAETGEAVVFEITSEAPVGVLAPDSAGQTVEFTVINPGPGTLNLSDVTVALADADGVAWVPTGTCLIADYDVAITTAPTFGPILATGEVTGTATVTLTSTAINQDDCQGQTVPLYFVAT